MNEILSQLGIALGLLSSLLSPNLGAVDCVGTIREKIVQGCVVDKANFKASEIVKLNFIGKYTFNGLDVEITKVKKMEGGIEVFARAWKNGNQLGFGSDGTVDLERFRIFNPPVLVDDPNGTIEKVMTDGKEVFGTRHLKEDPAEAIKQSLAHTISLVGRLNTKIVKGKVGNTTSTFYPNDGTATAPVDGRNARSVPDESFATIRAGTGNAVSMTATVGANGEMESGDVDPNFARMDRMAYGFNISIGSDTVNSATFSLYGTGSTNQLGGGMVIDISTTTPTDNDTTTTFINGDYEVAKFGSTKLATGIAVGSWNGAGYNDFTLNASGIAYIANGIKYFAARSGWDIDNSFGGSWSGAHNEARGLASMADEAGTTQDPKLVVVHGTVASTVLQSIIFFE